MRNVLKVFDLAAEEMERVFSITEDLKSKHAKGLREPLLPGRVIGLLFEKPSLRTRVSFETAIAHLGGGSLFLGKDVGWGERESIGDFAQVLSQYIDVVICRARSHRRVEELAEHCQCSVVNGLTDLSHPCQALADMYTLLELHGKCEGLKVVFVGDANNVARSLAVACAKLGAEFVIATPAGYQFEEKFVGRLQAEVPGARFSQTHDPVKAVQGADAVYTDVWASMGQEAEQAERAKAFADYQVNAALMKQAQPKACFLHCLPARRGEEVTDEVIDSPQSAVIQQAANRMHVQKGLLAWLLSATS
ncbi:MAG: ornithine carbamoyltransferase [Pirellulaceae bacterium]